jgi:[NiFe] hydrogenase assembly HybE family chaperone
MSDNHSSSNESARITELVERFREIGDIAMRDLPLYNANLEVEAVGFRPFEGGLLGVLITPWFMNLVLVPAQAAYMDMLRIGRKRKVSLPAGERELMQGGDERIGAYESLSLHFPMFAFETQAAARREAETRLAELMRSPAEPPPGASGRLRVQRQRISRRAFLRGESSGA